MQAELESIRPDDGHEELRVKLSALPLRLRLDQNIVTFLQNFFTEEKGKDSLLDSFEKVEWEEESRVTKKKGKVVIQATLHVCIFHLYIQIDRHDCHKRLLTARDRPGF